MTAPYLIIFDVDGTLIDSQAHIVASMEAAFGGHDLPAPSRAQTLSIVGLSLPVAMLRLAPDHSAEMRADLVEGYKAAFQSLRLSADGAALSPLFEGAMSVLEKLQSDPRFVLAIATGKSRRGMEHILDQHGLRSYFASVQVADDHPSKPHPAMVKACLSECDVPAARAVVIGDTTYDVEMAKAAGAQAIGVSWGYHSVEDLRQSGADPILQRFGELPAALERIWSLT